MPEGTLSIEVLGEVCEGVANGGSLITMCEKEGWVYSRIVNEIYAIGSWKEMYERALEARGEWLAQRLLKELQGISFGNRKHFFNSDGSLKEIDEIPDELASSINGIEVEAARLDKDGNEVSGERKKLKLVDKRGVIELLGKHLKMFTDKHEVSGRVSLEELVTGSMAPIEGSEVEVKSRGKEEERASGKETESEPKEAEGSADEDEI